MLIGPCERVDAGRHNDIGVIALDEAEHVHEPPLAELVRENGVREQYAVGPAVYRQQKSNEEGRHAGNGGSEQAHPPRPVDATFADLDVGMGVRPS